MVYRHFPDFAEYQRKIVNNLGYFALSQSRVGKLKTANNSEYYLQDTSLTARSIYWFFYINTAIKAMFLAFLFAGSFGPIEFLDKIAALIYILCVGIVTLGSCIWIFRYPLYEILHNFWKIENSIFAELGYPEDLKNIVDKRHYATVWIHLFLIWFGCTVLITQFYADPKYCAWTYSAFQVDTWYLRIIFCAREFIFILHPWNNMAGSSSLCTFQGIALSNVIDRMTETLERISLASVVRKAECGHQNGMSPNPTRTKSGTQETVDGRNSHVEKFTIQEDSFTRDFHIQKLIFYYKQLMIISEQFNDWVSYKIVFLHACGYCQFISDVFVAMQVLKIEGSGMMDVWFYIEDSLASMYMIYRVYTFMSRVQPSSDNFLHAFNLHLTRSIKVNDRKRLIKVAKTLRPVSLKLGPCPVTPMTVLEALDMLSNYYVCVALWN